MLVWGLFSVINSAIVGKLDSRLSIEHHEVKDSFHEYFLHGDTIYIALRGLIIE